jgi:hypothetical protein
MLLLASQNSAVVIVMNLVLVLMVSNRKLACHCAVVQCHARHYSQQDGDNQPQAPPAAMVQSV